MQLVQAIGAKIRDIRRERGISQETLAEMIDTAHSYIGAIENGRKNITIGTLEKIAVALEVNVTDFFEYHKVLSEKGKILDDIVVRLLEKDEQDLRKVQIFLDEILK